MVAVRATGPDPVSSSAIATGSTSGLPARSAAVRGSIAFTVTDSSRPAIGCGGVNTARAVAPRAPSACEPSACEPSVSAGVSRGTANVCDSPSTVISSSVGRLW